MSSALISRSKKYIRPLVPLQVFNVMSEAEIIAHYKDQLRYMKGKKSGKERVKMKCTYCQQRKTKATGHFQIGGRRDKHGKVDKSTTIHNCPERDGRKSYGDDDLAALHG